MFFIKYLIVKIIVQDYSYLSASTGFLVAALQLCQLTVSNATTRAITPARANTHELSSVFSANFCNHLSIVNQAMGQAMRKAIATHSTKSLLSVNRILVAVAPFTFLTPISFILPFI